MLGQQWWVLTMNVDTIAESLMDIITPLPWQTGLLKHYFYWPVSNQFYVRKAGDDVWDQAHLGYYKESHECSSGYKIKFYFGYNFFQNESATAFMVVLFLTKEKCNGNFSG